MSYLGLQSKVYVQLCETPCKNLSIKQNLSTAFHPCPDRQTEQMNAWVEQYL